MFFRRIKKFFVIERCVADIIIVHTFPIYQFPSETYQIRFIEKLSGRCIEVTGSDFATKRRIWEASELYIFLIAPWMRGIISTPEMISHLDIIKKFYYKSIKINTKLTDNNVIEISKYLSRKSAENQNEV